ncbi:MAG: signal recognition particle protein [Mycoplasmataceae bacterium]|nr:signal recognition particle protein [Mycoplasmataceae bacterium]MBR3259691.1 signal recognition particle protein [Mycoplasmataceae bacterium]MBR4025543.1 signal recognition particle protein [Mycoplasmataceae bacterium]
MFDFIGSRMQKAIAKANKKTQLKEEDILEITRDIRLALLEADVNLKVVKDFIDSVKKSIIGQDVIKQLNPGQQMVKVVKEELVKILGNKAKEIKINNKPYFIMMTGLQGGGKTTTVAKLAYYFRKKQNLEKILLVAADVYRPAAVDQLVSLAKQIGMDYFKIDNSQDVNDIVKKAYEKAYQEKYDLVIIDTAGRLSIDEKLMDELVQVKSIIKPNEIIFVADALSGQDIINVATTFHEKLKLTGSIITKLDSDARGGAALSIRYLLEIPILFIGTGEKVSNIDLFYPDRMADRILGMGDVLSLIEKAEEVIDERKSKKMLNKLMKGEFDLDDLLDNLRQVKKLGSIRKILKFLPGNLKIDETKAEKADEKLKLFEILISSMTLEERKDPRLLKNASRKNRIIKGSGRTVQEYNLLINEFEQMRKRLKEFSSKTKNGQFDPSSFGFGS